MTAVADVDLDALLCALVLAPEVFSRNRFFSLFEDRERARTRRRAARVRGIVRQLSFTQAEIIAQAELRDGQVLVRYRVPEIGFMRSVALSRLEAASLRFALHKAGKLEELAGEDRELVSAALQRLVLSLGLPRALLTAHGVPEDDSEAT